MPYVSSGGGCGRGSHCHTAGMQSRGTLIPATSNKSASCTHLAHEVLGTTTERNGPVTLGTLMHMRLELG